MNLQDLYGLHESLIKANHPELITGNFVPGFGVCGDFMFIAEAPGADEDKQRKPLVGKAGQLLRSIVGEITENPVGFDKFAFGTNVWKWRPPNNRAPVAQEVSLGKECLFTEIDIVNPHSIILLGRTAQSAINWQLERGKLYKSRRTGITYLYTYHPGYLLPHRSPHMIPIWKKHLQSIIGG